MGATEILTTRVTPEIKEQVTRVVRDEFLTESIWLRRLVLRELRAVGSESRSRPRGDGLAADARGGCSDAPVPGSSLYVRLRPEDRLLLHERAGARGMASATYVSVLVRSHMRSLSPLPKDELLALKRAVGELGAVGRNLNQIARAVNQGARAGGASHDEFRAILKICEALRDHTKGLIKANAASWSSGHAESAD
jgi:hypothetical protein